MKPAASTTSGKPQRSFRGTVHVESWSVKVSTLWNVCLLSVRWFAWHDPFFWTRPSSSAAAAAAAACFYPQDTEYSCSRERQLKICRWKTTFPLMLQKLGSAHASEAMRGHLRWKAKFKELWNEQTLSPKLSQLRCSVCWVLMRRQACGDRTCTVSVCMFECVLDKSSGSPDTGWDWQAAKSRRCSWKHAGEDKFNNSRSWLCYQIILL